MVVMEEKGRRDGCHEREVEVGHDGGYKSDGEGRQW